MALSMTQAMNIRADGSWTGQALIKLEAMAADNKTQGTIAAFFGIPKREFEAILAKNKGANEVRLAWERGRAQVEQRMQDLLYASAQGQVTEKTEMIPVLGADGKPTGEQREALVREIHTSKMAGSERMFFLKAQFGWKEGESAEAKVSNVTLMLPKPRSRKEFFAMMGVEDTKALPGPGGPTEMKDVTPVSDAAKGAFQLMAPGAPAKESP